MYPGGVRRSGLAYVPREAFPMIQRYRIYSDDIFVSVAGTLGIVGVVPPELNGANITENADRITDLKCDRDYLKYWLMSQPIQDSISAIATIGAQPKLALERISAFPVVLPRDSAEQRAIATTLSDVDGLIGLLEALIAKKRAIKQAAMQQLLTGRTRLPGFGGEWKNRRLGSMLSVRHGRDHQGSKTKHGRYPLLGSGGLMGRTNRSVFGKPSVLIGRKGTINKPQFMSGPFWAVDTLFYTDIRPHESAKFLYFLFCQINWLAHNEASGLPSLNSRTIEQIVVSAPALPEQQAIASVLSDMDAEIAALERRLDKTRAIKQGMMQLLLTGSIRLPIPDADTENDHAHDA